MREERPDRCLDETPAPSGDFTHAVEASGALAVISAVVSLDEGYRELKQCVSDMERLRLDQTAKAVNRIDAMRWKTKFAAALPPDPPLLSLLLDAPLAPVELAHAETTLTMLQAQQERIEERRRERGIADEGFEAYKHVLRGLGAVSLEGETDGNATEHISASPDTLGDRPHPAAETVGTAGSAVKMGDLDEAASATEHIQPEPEPAIDIQAAVSAAVLGGAMFAHIERVYLQARKLPDNRHDHTLIDGYTDALEVVIAARDAALAQIMDRDPTIIHEGATVAYTEDPASPSAIKSVYIPGWGNPITITSRSSGTDERLRMAQTEKINGKDYTGGLYPSQINYMVQQVRSQASQLLGEEALELLDQAAREKAEGILTARLSEATEKAHSKTPAGSQPERTPSAKPEPIVSLSDNTSEPPQPEPSSVGLNLASLLDPDVSSSLQHIAAVESLATLTAAEQAADNVISPEPAIPAPEAAQSAQTEEAKIQPKPVLNDPGGLWIVARQRRDYPVPETEPGMDEVRHLLHRHTVGATVLQRLANRARTVAVDVPLATLSAVDHARRRQPSDPTQPFVKVKSKPQTAAPKPATTSLRNVLQNAAAVFPLFTNR